MKKTGKQLKDEGIKKVREKNLPWVLQARSIAIKLAKKNGTVTSDDVQKKLPRPKKTHPNSVGAVFHTDCFRPTGFVQSHRPTAHRRWIRIYKFVN